MVFGTTYCAISHLPIEDGDKCILIPLGFRMDYEFTRHNKADINSFMFLYCFVAEAQEVIYEGNPDQIKYLNTYYEQTELHELYMLVHFKFYREIQKEYMLPYNNMDHLSDVHLFKTTAPIYFKFVEKLREEEKLKLVEELSAIKASGDKNARNEWSSKLMRGGNTPEWIKEIYRVAMFMDGMGIMPYPNHTVDQHEKNLLYEKTRSQFNKIK